MNVTAAEPARDEVSPAAVTGARPEVALPFDPARPVGDFQVKVWRPGERVRFDHRTPKRALGCLFLVLLAPASLFFVAVDTLRDAGGGLDVMLVAALLLAVPVALAVGLLFRRHWNEFDWGTRKLILQKGGKTIALPFAQLRALEVRGVRIRDRRADRSLIYRAMHPDTYQCEVLVHYQREGGQPRSAMIVETAISSDPAPSWRQAFPLMTELAAALGIEGRATPYAPPP